MKVLITGASGFIGMNLRRHLRDRSDVDLFFYVHSSDPTLSSFSSDKIILSTSDIGTLTQFCIDNTIDGIIHLASLFIPSHTSHDIEALVESNIQLGVKLLEASVSANVKWFLNTGTFWQHYNSAAYSPVNLYAATKEAFENIAQYYWESFPINFATLKLSDTFGPRDTRKKILNLLIEAAISKKPIALSPGLQKLSLNYVDDVVSAFMCLADHLHNAGPATAKGQSFNMTSNQIVSLKELHQICEKVLNTSIPVEWGGRPYRNREVMEPWNLIAPVPGWTQKTSLEDGIRKTLGL